MRPRLRVIILVVLSQLALTATAGAGQVALTGSGEAESNVHTGIISIIAGNSDNSATVQSGSSTPKGDTNGVESFSSCGLKAPPPGVFPSDLAGLSFDIGLTLQDPARSDDVSIIPAGAVGSWYIYSCNTPGDLLPLPVFVPGVPGTPGPPPPPSPAQLAQIAYGEIRLPAPGLQLSPSTQANPAIPQIVGAPTWAWVPSSSWAPLSATASAGPVVVTATASPAMIRLSYTDGGQTSTTGCRGPGTPYSDGLAGRESPAAPLSAASPDCGWTYRHPSARAPGGRVPVTGVVTYNVTWTVTGAPGGGDLGPLNSPPTTYSVPVSEIQVLNTR